MDKIAFKNLFAFLFCQMPSEAPYEGVSLFILLVKSYSVLSHKQNNSHIDVQTNKLVTSDLFTSKRSLGVIQNSVPNRS